ncbi:hypothetical protein IP87_00655 [beta proteobacterium AAP121]|nr:hypothetical protein IP80_14055 [beta proteobacterium AAP65]KPG00882.1 hypothetical protein IP87_00655 [beta proteobacterium AAP121]
MLGDAVVDAALAPLQERLAALNDAPPEAEPGTLAAPATSGRRLRQVSVLFLDIVGSTQLIQHLDPEEVQAVFDGALAAFTAIVTRHGGEVLRYAGDNLKAAFGAHGTLGTREDDAERAVHCGLALLAEAARRGDAVQRTQGHGGFSARIGIHTGPAVRGGGVENDNSLSGLTVNIAARLEQAAAPGALLISQDTWALVRGGFEAMLQPPLAAKGVAAPLTCWQVQAARPASQAPRARGLPGAETPLIGRQAERALLAQALARVQAEGRPQAVTLIANAGVGKSRLLAEFQRNCAAQCPPGCLLAARSQPSGHLQPYGLWRDLLLRQLAIADGDSADLARHKLLQGLAPWLAQPDDPPPEALGHLVGLDFSASPAVQRLGSDARLLRDRAVLALRLWLQRLAAHHGAPVVLLLDDLHWADEASLDTLHTVLNKGSGALLALLGARPALLEQQPGWGQALLQHERLDLQALGAEEGRALTQALLHQVQPLPAALAALIEGRAEGNPFYAEELVGMLLDQGVLRRGSSPDAAWFFDAARLDPQRLPTTITGVLQARLDALDANDRRALQLASVVGPVFWDEALGALDAQSPKALPALHSKALVQARAVSTFEGTAEAAFQHHLLHQVTYSTVLKPQKREAHARAAAWLTQRVGDRGDEYLAITGEHCARAGEHRLAAEWFLRASRRAKARFAYTAALQYIDQAEAQAALAAQTTGLSPPELQHELLNRRVLICDSLALREQQEVAIDRLLALGEAEGQDHWVAEALASRSMLAYRTGRLPLAEAAARRGVEVAERIDDAKNATLSHITLAFMAVEQRSFEAARRGAAAALHWAVLARQRMREERDDIFEVQALLVQAHLHGALAEEGPRSEVLAHALALARPMNNPRLTCTCLEFVVESALDSADAATATVHINEAARLAADFGLPVQQAIAQSLRARCELLAGDLRQAAHTAADAAQRHRACNNIDGALKCQQLQAEALWRSGMSDAAIQLWREDAATLQQRGDEVSARALRLRLADAAAPTSAHVGGEPDTSATTAAALRSVLAELPFLQQAQALATAPFGLAARLAAWRVLHRAGHPAAAQQRALAAEELAQALNAHTDPAVRARVCSVLPWHRDVAAALAQTAEDRPPATVHF